MVMDVAQTMKDMVVRLEKVDRVINRPIDAEMVAVEEAVLAQVAVGAVPLVCEMDTQLAEAVEEGLVS